MATGDRMADDWEFGAIVKEPSYAELTAELEEARVRFGSAARALHALHALTSELERSNERGGRREEADAHSSAGSSDLPSTSHREDVTVREAMNAARERIQARQASGGSAQEMIFEGLDELRSCTMAIVQIVDKGKENMRKKVAAAELRKREELEEEIRGLITYWPLSMETHLSLGVGSRKLCSTKNRCLRPWRRSGIIRVCASSAF